LTETKSGLSDAVCNKTHVCEKRFPHVCRERFLGDWADTSSPTKDLYIEYGAIKDFDKEAEVRRKLGIKARKESGEGDKEENKLDYN
jgi:hypothetical protein